MFNHCGMKFKPIEVWFLADTKECTDRTLYIGFCPRCLKDFTCLIETDKIKNQTYYKIKQGNKAIKEVELCRADKLYTSQDVKVQKGTPSGWIYGENKEIHNRKGEVISIRQKACDFYGQKEIIKTVSVAIS